jgi:hypothetical protein
VADEPRTEASKEATSANEQLPDELSLKVELRLEGVVLRESTLLKSGMLPYVRMIVSLIEGIKLSCRGLVKLLRQALRQHSIAYQRRTEYVLCFLHQHPP